jgi:hypothetical protein
VRSSGNVKRRHSFASRSSNVARNALTTSFAGGGLKGGTQYGSSDEFGYKSVENRVNDIHATVLHQMGIKHTDLTYRFNGRAFRLTDVAGKVLHDIPA